jgi:hypothetical protein
LRSMRRALATTFAVAAAFSLTLSAQMQMNEALRKVEGAGKLDSLDGVAGLRVAHNVDVKVSNFKITK